MSFSSGSTFLQRLEPRLELGHLGAELRQPLRDRLALADVGLQRVELALALRHLVLHRASTYR